ncbi:MAG: hypothetical protein R3C01_17125 [Planctomycetaceae bacterium]
MKRTIRGERDAILKVLRLDADIRSSKRFSPVVEEFVQNYSDAEMTCSHEPVTGFAPAGFSATGVKALVCGWIVSWSQLLEKAVPRLMKAFTNPDIRSLFDAIARDTTGKLRDEDLQTDDEAFRKMSRRYRKEFNVMWWDIFGVGIVPG